MRYPITKPVSMSAPAVVAIATGDRATSPAAHRPARRLLRTREAAAYLGMSAWRLRQIIADGQMPVVASGEGKPFLLDVCDLDAWIERNKQLRPPL